MEDFFHPETGYQINILSKIWSSMGHEVYILTSTERKVPKYLKDFLDFEGLHLKDQEYSEKYGVKIKRFNPFTNISNRMIFKNDILKFALSLKPDILYIHGNDTFIGIKVALRLSNIKVPVIMDSHMIEVASKNKFSKIFQFLYSKFITPKLVNRNMFLIKTSDTNFINEKFKYPYELTPLIGFGSDVSLFKFNEQNRNSMRAKFNISDESRVFIYAGKLEKSKGIGILVNAINEKFTSHYNPVFLIIGNPNYDYNFISEISKIDNPIIHLSTQKYNDLPKYFHMADIMIIPAQNSLTFYDAQAAQLPCILSSDNINLRRVSHGNGTVFEKDNSEDLRNKIKEYLNISKEEINKQKAESFIYISENYNYEVIASNYLSYINKSIQLFKDKG